ncbi:Fic family protein [Bosea vaviloviae]|uniref:Fic family protein n=1 Tax=Bosea vaviloviae TaxID=1526658 RepID=UPI0009E76E1B|nr:Fic family protein [Bosea vaviloviae]
MADRHSRIDEPELIVDPEEKALAEARNALRQFDIGMVLLDHWLDNAKKSPKLRLSDLLTLNRFALEDINRFAGTFRTQPVVIDGSLHEPPEAGLVPKLSEDLCDYINANWTTKSAIHLSAYALWRINWVHPFADGNGRTARILSYIILCAKYGYRLPGTNTIPEQIAADKKPYYQALEHADLAFKIGRIDVSAVETLIESALRAQIEDALLQKAEQTGRSVSSAPVIRGELLVGDIPRVDKIILTLNLPSSGDGDKNFIERNPVLSARVFAIVTALISFALGKIT